MKINTTDSFFGQHEEPTTTTTGSEVKVTVHEFKPFTKIPRLSREIVVTEKIDGTNAHVYISDDLQTVLAASRTRFLSPGKTTDNHGFAQWVEENKEELKKFGPGRHYGEWWGKGINRGYGLEEKRFSMFNPKWKDQGPKCVSVVPVLYQGEFSQAMIDTCMVDLMLNGSQAAPGFMEPEGIVVYHTAAAQYFKKTIVGDEKPKGQTDGK